MRFYGKLPDVKINHAHLSLNIPKRDAIIYKMHGDISDLANTVWINIMIQWKEFNTKGIKMYRPVIN
jgi:hypothetical protein